MKWKISKIKIQSFKAFENISFDFENSNLLTLDGPNGYGKTSIFDAIELLLTGKIGRTRRLFTSIMPANKTNYGDNLYWNKKQKETDLYIKAEFLNTDTGEKLVLGRMAKKQALLKVQTNRADNFDIFNLYKLENYDSTDFSTIAEEGIIEELFGENFSESYPLLNYLEQGQNSFLFSKKTDQRKEALEQLINTVEINKHIEKYTKIERRINANYLSKEKRNSIATLKDKIVAIQEQVAGSDLQEQYFKLTTKSPTINWDTNPPFSIHDPELFNAHIQNIQALKNLIEKKEEIKVKLKNQSIDDYLVSKKDLIFLTIEIGKHIQRHASLNTVSATIKKLKIEESILNKDIKTISDDDLNTLLASGLYNLPKDLREKIADRDLLLEKNTSSALTISELGITKSTLIEIYKKIHSLDGHCPLCGNDWTSAQKLLKTIEETQLRETNNLDQTGIQLDANLKYLSDAFLDARKALTSHTNEQLKKFDEKLFERLNSNKEKFDSIEEINKYLENNNIIYSSSFTIDQEEIKQRSEKVISAIRDTKENEIGELPADWQVTIGTLFEKPDDIQNLTVEAAEQKSRFITMSHSLVQSTTLTTLIKELSSLENEATAASQLKEKINKLKTELIDLEKKYAGQTISDIELTFHIYSGRLIQNYQRGLGLFIERGDGSHLRFSTAEHSEHDALLSMSSGQISALSLAFFFSLNRVYSRNSLILIDDPAQSLDEINIASLSDLLRCELKDRQLIISSHEEDISSYIRYRFSRAGLSQKGIHMQKHINMKH
jgi:exonuclease SbcC